jgi:hypothetical protein
LWGFSESALAAYAPVLQQEQQQQQGDDDSDGNDGGEDDGDVVADEGVEQDVDEGTEVVLCQALVQLLLRLDHIDECVAAVGYWNVAGNNPLSCSHLIEHVRVLCELNIDELNIDELKLVYNTHVRPVLQEMYLESSAL